MLLESMAVHLFQVHADDEALQLRIRAESKGAGRSLVGAVHYVGRVIHLRPHTPLPHAPLPHIIFSCFL